MHPAILDRNRKRTRAKSSSPLEIRVQDLQPVAARPAPVAAAGALRHDPLEAELAGVGEHDRALGRQRLR